MLCLKSVTWTLTRLLTVSSLKYAVRFLVLKFWWNCLVLIRRIRIQQIPGLEVLITCQTEVVEVVGGVAQVGLPISALMNPALCIANPHTRRKMEQMLMLVLLLLHPVWQEIILTGNLHITVILWPQKIKCLL
uniref:Uncharacterized protein n=1 Tax=Salix viminalis TaxID=40686 RepID=A0A6N2M8A1_SALVM